jgi:CubicO group peptidase (beta-lactamase class C family)
MRRTTAMILLLVALAGCGDDDAAPEAPAAAMYFPPADYAEWHTAPPASLGWNEAAIGPLKDYLAGTGTRSFMILVDGRIVMEEYFAGHDASATWPWNSAGKTLLTAITGIARQSGLLDVEDLVSAHVGTGWTATTTEQEDLIEVRHLLTMTSGLDDSRQLVVPANLTWVANAGERWSYHNVFQVLFEVVAAAADQPFAGYFDAHLRDRIGMDGVWNVGPIFTIYHSTTRSMARFGLLALNQGRWDGEQIVDEEWFTDSTRSSQDINPSYGYLWWLNGKASYMVPGGQDVYTGPLVPNAPADMHAAMGAEDQRLYVVPSRAMVIVRMGEASDPDHPSFALSGFDNDLWERIDAVID